MTRALKPAKLSKLSEMRVSMSQTMLAPVVRQICRVLLKMIGMSTGDKDGTIVGEAVMGTDGATVGFAVMLGALVGMEVPGVMVGGPVKLVGMEVPGVMVGLMVVIMGVTVGVSVMVE